MKFRSVDHGHLLQVLMRRGAVAAGAVDQEDLYLNHPSRDFRASREALRIRRVGEENRITYKGPRHAGPTKTREEIEIPAGTGRAGFEHLVRLFGNLGFRPVATVRKRRETFHLQFQELELEIVLDAVEGLGAFAEIETFAAGPSELPAAQQAVMALAAELGLTDVEPRSYLGLILQTSTGSPGGDVPCSL